MFIFPLLIFHILIQVPVFENHICIPETQFHIYPLILFNLSGIAFSSFGEFELSFSIHFQVVSPWDSPVLAQEGIFLGGYFGVKTCEVFLCFVAIVRARVYYIEDITRW